MHDLPASLQDFRNPSIIQTSASGGGNAVTNFNDNGYADEEIVSPLSWPGDSLLSSQWSPEAAALTATIQSLNTDELSHINLTGQDDLCESASFLQTVSTPAESVSWGYIPDQALGTANPEYDLTGQSSFEAKEDTAGEQFLPALANSNSESGYPLHGAFLDSSALSMLQDLIVPSGSVAHCESEPLDVPSLIGPFPAPATNLASTSYGAQSGNFPATLQCHDQPVYAHGQAIGWQASPNDVWDWEAANFGSSDPRLDLLGSSDDNSANTLFFDQLLQPGPSATDIGASDILNGVSSTSASQLPASSNIVPFSDIAIEDQSQHSPDTDNKVHIRRVQSSNSSTHQQSPSSTLSPARSRYHGPVPSDDHQPKRRQPFQVLQKRIETGEMRKVGACVRCRMQRLRVSGFLSGAPSHHHH